MEEWGHTEPQGGRGREFASKFMVRLGLSLAGSSLVAGGGSVDAIFLDSEGFFSYGKVRTRVSHRFGQDDVVALLVNLDPSSPNANTVSLFCNGVRACEPQAVPERLLGKALWPHISYKNATVQVNLGPHALAPLPFKCPLLAGGAAEDLELAPPSPEQCQAGLRGMGA